MLKKILAVISAILISSGISAGELSAKKQTRLELYVDAREAFEMLSTDERTVLIDIRSLAEITFLGMPTLAHANIEYSSPADYSKFNELKGSFDMVTNPNFVTEVVELVTNLNLTQSDPIILMCRSGVRSARAADLLAQSGFTQVYTMTDGYEGDIARKGETAGQRDLNGWKNAGLPWSYRLDLSKLYDAPARH